MARRTENNARMCVPDEFGGWDQKGPAAIDYSMVFSQARANTKRQKIDVIRPNLGNQQQHDSIAASNSSSPQQQDEDSVAKKKKILTYINCCIRP